MFFLSSLPVPRTWVASSEAGSQPPFGHGRTCAERNARRLRKRAKDGGRKAWTLATQADPRHAWHFPIIACDAGFYFVFEARRWAGHSRAELRIRPLFCQ